MKPAYLCIPAMLLAAATPATANGSEGLRAAQARFEKAHIPLVVELNDAHRISDHRVVLTLKLWSSDLRDIYTSVPSGYAGWRIHGVDLGGATRVRTIGIQPYRDTGNGGHNAFLARYNEPVTIPVVIDDSNGFGRNVSVDVAFTVCGVQSCYPQTYTFKQIPLD